MATRQPPTINRSFYEHRTSYARRYVADVLDMAETLTKDPRKSDRLEKQECKTCFYSSRLGGAAITEQPCAGCGKHQSFPSTNTGVFCMDCASANDLCKHCGGDIKLRIRRKGWPYFGG